MLKFVICLTVVATYSKANEHDVPLLDPETMQSKVLDSREFWLVEYFKNFSSEITFPLSSKLSLYGINTARLNCSDKINKAYCQSAFTTQFPSFRVFIETPILNPYTNKFYRNPIVHHGMPDSKELEKFVSRQYADTVKKVSSDEEFGVLSANSSGPVAVLISEKETVSMLFKSVAFGCRINSTISIFVQTTKNASPSLESRLGVSTAPALVLHFNNGSVLQFPGDLKDRSSIIEWCHVVAPNVTDAAPAANLTESAKIALRTQTLMKNLHKNIYAASPSTFGPEVMAKNLFSWVVLVHEIQPEANATVDAALSNALSAAAKRCDGALQPALLLCTNNTAWTDQLEDVSEDELGDALCMHSSAPLPLPYLLVVPHGAAARKKMRKSMAKWTFAVADVDAALRKAGDALSDSRVTVVTESSLNDFINFGVARNLLSVVLLTDKEGAVPGMLRNLGLVVGSSQGPEEVEAEVQADLGLELAQVAMLSKPSEGFLRGAAGAVLTLPSLVAFFAADDESGKKLVRMALFDPRQYGGLRVTTAREFVITMFKSANLPPPERVLPTYRSKKEDATVRDAAEAQEAAEVAEPLDAEAEEFLAEIRREEEAKAAARKLELEEEARARAEEARRLKDEEKDKKKLKIKKKKKKVTAGNNDAEL